MSSPSTVPRRARCEHGLFVLYSLMLIWLLSSCLYYAQSADEPMEFARPLILCIATFWIGYFAVSWLIGGWTASPGLRMHALPDRWIDLLIVSLFALFLGVIIIHLSTLGYLPAWRAWHAQDDFAAARIRQEGYYALDVWKRYASDYAIKGIGPTVLVLAMHRRSPVFWPALLAGAFYTTSLFVKVNPIYLLLPLVFYLCLRRRFAAALGIAFVMVASVAVNWSISSAEVREDLGAAAMPLIQKSPHRIGEPSRPQLDIPGWTLVLSFRERLIIVPSRVIAQWYYQYKDSGDREDGCGYRLVAKLLGCDYVHIPTKLYGIYYQELVRGQGLTGSLNSGSYMHDFANYGYTGVVLGAIVFALLFSALRFLCRGQAPLLALNVMPVLSLAEMPLTTLLNSGGWMFIMLASLLVVYGGHLLPAALASEGITR